MDWGQQRIAVLGAGLSGSAIALFLASRGAKATLCDAKPEETFSQAAQWRAAGLALALGSPMPPPQSFDAAFISPGINPNIPAAQSLAAAGVPLYGELLLVAQETKAPFIAITGTNGKTTTTALTGHILKEAGKEVFVGGNIGIPLIQGAPQVSPEGFVVGEISSFQLERPGSFAPQIAAILNITPDHLDRHGDMAGYIRAKAQIFRQQKPEDILVLNADDATTAALALEAPSRVIFFSREKQLEQGVFVADGQIVLQTAEKRINILPVAELYIKGGHNLANALAAVAMCYYAGLTPQEIAEGLKSFQGVAHRQEVVGEFGGVLYINDSKGTNPDSTIQALQAYDRPMVLILGGYDKAADFSALLPLIRQKVHHVITMGATEEKICQMLQSHGYTAIAKGGDDFDKVTELACEAARPGGRGDAFPCLR